MDLSIKYVDGGIAHGDASMWASMPPDGVDSVDLKDGTYSYRMQGQSIYWTRREKNLWVVGGGLVTNIQEAMAYGNGSFVFTRPSHMPDLKAEAVKLGWWLP